MAEYNITLSDGSETITIPENVVDKDKTSIALIGHGEATYGEPQNENFVHMLENFASEYEPNMPIRGQLWFKKNEDGKTYELNVCKTSATEMYDDGTSNAEWDKLMKSSASEAEAPSNPSNGDIWYDPVSHQLKIYDSELNDWNIIGPADVTRDVTEYFSEVSNSGQTSSTFIFDSTHFMKNIPDSVIEDGYTGSLHMVTLKVLIKEVVKPQIVSYDLDRLRSAAFIYRFVVRTLSSENETTISIFGSPNYEILAKSDDLNFSMDLTINAGNVKFKIDNTSAASSSDTYFVNGIDMNISRI